MADKSSSAGSKGAEHTIAIEMPRLSSEDETATLAAWLVAEGDVVEKGTLVAELETDKATVELESPAQGRVESLVVRAGTEGLKPGMLLARIAPVAAATPSKKRSTAKAPASAAVLARSPATPLARRLADSEGLALDGVTGSGIGGRIEKVDVERLASASTAAKTAPVAAEEARAAATLPNATSDPSNATSTQSGAAARAHPARSRVSATPIGMPRPAVQLELRCEMDAVVAARARLNASQTSGSAGARSLTLNDFVLRASALALRDVPEANLRRADDGFHSADGVDVAVVVGTAAGPVLVVLRDADRKGLAVLSEEIGVRIEQARAPEPPEPEDPTASLLVTSFGRFGIESAHPMLPPEQVAVLAVGAVVEQPVVRAGGLGIASKMALTLAFDPGAAGGAVMARLLGAIRRHLEDPLGMML